MPVDTMFRRMPSSPRLRSYACKKMQSCELLWQRSLDLRLAFTRDQRGVQVELCGRDSEGHFISCRGHGADGFSAIDNLYLKLCPQGLLLAHTSPPQPPNRPLERRFPQL